MRTSGLVAARAQAGTVEGVAIRRSLAPYGVRDLLVQIGLWVVFALPTRPCAAPWCTIERALSGRELTIRRAPYGTRRDKILVEDLVTWIRNTWTVRNLK